MLPDDPNLFKSMLPSPRMRKEAARKLKGRKYSPKPAQVLAVRRRFAQTFLTQLAETAEARTALMQRLANV